MTFTDDDLKRLKEFQWASKERTDALILRLEAAENAYLTYRNDPEVRHTPEQVEAGLAWRKSAGRDK